LSGCGRGGAAISKLLQPTPEFRLEAAVRRLVIPAIFGEVRLIDPAVGMIVGVFVPVAVAELLRSPVVVVAKVLGHGQGAAG
jgi:hypothetical protein